MKILVSGACGNLGRMIIEHMLKKGMPSENIVAGAYSPEKIQDLAEKGVKVVKVDYDDVDVMRKALEGIDRFCMISFAFSCVDRALEQHNNVIEAAKDANLEMLAYTSCYNCPNNRSPLAYIHQATEKALEESGLPYVFLRNTGYMSQYVDYVLLGIKNGVIKSASGNGRISAATRMDLAEATAIIMMGDKNQYVGKALELCGDTPFTFADLAKMASNLSGKPVSYEAISIEENMQINRDNGFAEDLVQIWKVIDEFCAADGYYSTDRTLSAIIGHPTMTMEEYLKDPFDRRVLTDQV